MSKEPEGIGGRNPNKNPYYPYDRDTTRGEPILTGESMHETTPRTEMIPASCEACGLTFGYFPKGEKHPQFCKSHSWMEGMFFVTSSNLEAIAWHEENLYVQFKDENWYVYEGVPELIYKALATANQRKESVGALFTQIVKRAIPQFPYKKIGKLKAEKVTTFPTPVPSENAIAGEQQRGVLSGKGVVNAIGDQSQTNRGVK